MSQKLTQYEVKVFATTMSEATVFVDAKSKEDAEEIAKASINSVDFEVIDVLEVNSIQSNERIT